MSLITIFTPDLGVRDVVKIFLLLSKVCVKTDIFVLAFGMAFRSCADPAVVRGDGLGGDKSGRP